MSERTDLIFLIVTEDYTSYESASDNGEDEGDSSAHPATTEKAPQQSKAQAPKKTEKTGSTRPSKTASTAKSTTSKKATGQSMMTNYFKGSQKS